MDTLKKMGRPPSKDPKMYRIGIRLTEKEYRLLNEYCKIKGLTKTVFIKQCMQHYIEEEI